MGLILHFPALALRPLLIIVLTALLIPFASEAQRVNQHRVRSIRLSEGERIMRGHYDSRRQQREAQRHIPTRNQLAALQQLQRQITGLQVQFNPLTGTPRHMFSLSQRLSAPRTGDPVTIAREFLKTHQALFRFQDRDLDDLVVVKNYRTQHNGVAHLVFKQFYRGLEIFQGHLKVNVDREGQILSLNGTYFPGIVASLSPALTAAEAVEIAVKDVAPDLDVALTVKTPAQGVAQAITFDRGPFTQDITAKLVLFPAHDGVRLTWKVRSHLMERLAWYDTLVDAHTGEILFFYNLYKFDEPQGMVFEINPDVGPQVLRSFVGDPVASPETWVDPLPNIATQGNNIVTLPVTQAPEQHFDFPFANLYETEGVNAFDLGGQTLRFTPNADGGYDAELLPLSFDMALGTNVVNDLSFFGLFSDANDGSARVNLGFAFPIFGESYRSAFINANGLVTFGLDELVFEGSWADLILGVPRIAVLWADLNPGTASNEGGVFVKLEEGRAVITWNQVPEFPQVGSNTVQLTLLDTGGVDISFADVSLRDAMVGVSRGRREVDVQSVDFSSDTPITGSTRGLAEKFPTKELDTATTNLFYHLNFMHDYLYNLGFDEAAGNFQVNNFDRGGLGGDPVLAWPQHTGFNNAFFGTPEDGIRPFTGYFFFTDPPFRQVDSAFDADIIYHEYGHGLTTRLVGNPFDIAVLIDFQSGAMGEGWSDIYSVSITEDTIVGEYVTGNATTGIRSVNYASNQLFYGQFGNRFGPISDFFVDDPGGIALDQTFVPQVHRDGEIWASTLWDLRASLGKDLFEQLITDALKLTPSNPSMLAARDAILLADVASYGSANQEAIWSVFAARGMGVSAQSNDGNDTVVFQAFDTSANVMVTKQQKQETIFFDDMESGENGWTVAGDNGTNGPALWHLSTRRGSTAWYYGQENLGTYDTGARNFGALTSPIIPLPMVSGQNALILEFDYFLRAEPSSAFFDNGYVRVVDQETGAITQVGCLINNTIGGFEQERIDLTQFAGRSVQIVFYFDPLDDFANASEGWYIDNVRVSQGSP